MRGLVHIRHFAWLLVAALLFAKGAAAVHAAEHGIGHDHDHDDAVCVVYLLAEDQTPLAEPVVLDTPPVEEVPAPRLVPAQIAVPARGPSCRAPPP
ncbi:MAG: hypothetical protein WBG08_09825, partial [Litorimonas sp.]